MKLIPILLTLCLNIQAIAYTIPTDASRSASTPHLSSLKNKEVMLTWTEKDSGGMQYFYVAFSKDQGKTFSGKNLIYSHEGIGSSRLMKPKVLEKGDGTLVAVFSLRVSSNPTPQPAAASHEGHSNGMEATSAACLQRSTFSCSTVALLSRRSGK